eukprot:scaffold50030_cov27-Tisochrysis_lutea.AAC.5
MAADWIVIPRWRSCSRKSVTVSPVSTVPAERVTPASSNIRSVVVVLPASTWAMMPTFRWAAALHTPRARPSAAAPRRAARGAPTSRIVARTGVPPDLLPGLCGLV